jgi:predicted SprT family Zn-dependent metalloprotease
MEILSTILHEMVHLWERVFEDAPRKSYHTKVWAAKMEELGLMPSSTGEVGGKRTGQKCSHYVIEGGEFEKVCSAFLIGGKHIEWQSLVEEEKEKPEKPKKKKFVYNCPNCLEVEVTSKTEVRILCGDCDAELVLQEDEPE